MKNIIITLLFLVPLLSYSQKNTDKTPVDFKVFMKQESTKKWKATEIKEVTAPSIRIGMVDKKHCKLATKEISKHISYENFKKLSMFQQANLAGRMAKYIENKYRP